jgi:hypothetical protein
MTSKEINLTPPLEMGKTFVDGLKGPWGITMNSDPKVSQKVPKGGIKNGELIPKTWKKGETTKQKGRPLDETTREDT